MSPRFPGYNVLDKRNTLSWNEPTRRAIDRRLSVHPGPRFFKQDEWATLSALCGRIIPQPKDRPPVPIAAYVDEKMFSNTGDGYRFADLPVQGEAWRIGLAALEAAAKERNGASFHALPPAEQDDLIGRVQRGELHGPAWKGMSPKLFFTKRVLHDITTVYYAHPTAWNEMGWSGPASPRGYVRLDADKSDPWEAAEAHPGTEARALRRNKHVV